MMTNNEIKLLENIEFHLGFAENNVQFEEKLKIFLSPVIEKLASSHEIVQIKAYDNLTEKDKITHLQSLIKNIELKPCNQKKFLFKIILEFLRKSSLKFADLETKEVYYILNFSHLLTVAGKTRVTNTFIGGQQELLCQSQSLKAKIMDYLCKSKLAANTFPAMLHVSFDCLYSPKTDEKLQKQGVKFIQWITRMVDNSRLKLIGKALLLKIIKETGAENLDNLTREQEIKTLLFKPFYGPLDLSIHSPEEDNENLKVIIIKFQEFNQLNQLDQWINDANIREMENILKENTNEHFSICTYLKEY
ncbi:ARM repeat-containing protein [Gigaspora margarita]|uniref:ARM repeat-containing protein n=1 Tax=Gigaspora margarita TaxID=4874 RepID=A0A8H3WW87_GIGMA|nr:ARM repeat-containing protein [Gigaspora margarita]